MRVKRFISNEENFEMNAEISGKQGTSRKISVMRVYLLQRLRRREE